MFIRTRPALIDEIPDLFERFGQPFAYEADIRSQVPEVWQRLVLEERIMLTVFEDLDRTEDPIFGLEGRVYAKPRFFHSYATGRKPYVGNEIVKGILVGEDPVLTREETKAAHQGEGLYCIFFNDPMGRTKFSEQEIAHVDAAWSRAFDQLSWINLEEIGMEVYGEFLLEMSGHCGALVRNEFAEFWEDHGSAVGSELRPYFVGMNRKEAMWNRGTHCARLFARRYPRLALTRAQQEMLVFAVAGQTDPELADSLFLSLSAIKKRWTAIYAVVDAMLPGLLPATAIGEDSARGSEKRRHLLNYLREHRHELEPLNAVERTSEPTPVVA